MCHPVRTLWLVAVVLVTVATARAENWPAWRGPRGDGTSHDLDFPIEWDGSTGTNIRWNVPVPGRGHSSPVVWDRRIFLTTCREDVTERVLLCFARDTGRLLWQRVVFKGPLEGKRDYNSYASGTAATDGEQVYVSFLEPDGSQVPIGDTEKFKTPGHVVVAAYDMHGELRWLARPGRFIGVNGYSCSPVLYRDLVIINADHDGTGYLVALDRQTGDVRWKTERKNKVLLGSFVTPLIREVHGRTQMVLSGNGCVESLNPQDGSRHWLIDGPTMQFVASPVFDGKLFFISAGHPKKELLAIRPDGHGNVSRSHIAWRTIRGCAMIPSPIVVGDSLLIVDDDGVASSWHASTGQLEWRKRLGSKYFASPVLASGLVYVVTVNGVAKVIKPGPEFELVAENNLGDVGEECYASPAFSEGQIFQRVPGHLFCIGTNGADP